MDFGHFHENMVELWIVLEGQLDFLIEGEPFITGTVGDVVQAPNERWHRGTSRAPVRLRGSRSRRATRKGRYITGSRTRKEATISDSSELSSSHT
jgi:quercetin dioxygenase-like cupin family protein